MLLRPHFDLQHQMPVVTEPDGSPAQLPRITDVASDWVGRRRTLRTSASWFVRMAQEDRDSPLPRSVRLAAWRMGFRAETAWLQGFPDRDLSLLINDFEWYFRCSRINWSLFYFRQKISLRALLLASGFRQAETLAMVSNGVCVLDPFGPARRTATEAELMTVLLRDGGPFILKPEDSNYGQGISRLEIEGDAVVAKRGGTAAPFRMPQHGVSLIERMLRQGPFWESLFPESANTMRVLTMWPRGARRPFIARASQRFGVSYTAPTDNWGGGGIGAPIDVETGRLGRGYLHPRRIGDRPTIHATHPETGRQIEGTCIPDWDRIHEQVLRVAASLPIYRYVGWDVLVDTDGEVVIVEGNGNSGLNILQLEHGLLEDPRARQFYIEAGVIEPARR